MFGRRGLLAFLIVLGICAAGSVTGLMLAVSKGASGGSGGAGPVARDAFAVFGTGRPATLDPQIESLAEDVGVDVKDRTQFRVLNSGLGQFHSRLVAFPARSGHNICYSLLGGSPRDPGMSYCYVPHDASQPAIADEHFSVVALESVIKGKVSTQVFGVAENDVKRIRVRAAGVWHRAAMRKNGFYVDLPGVAHANVHDVEATLADGSKQVHDIQTDSLRCTAAQSECRKGL